VSGEVDGWVFFLWRRNIREGRSVKAQGLTDLGGDAEADEMRIATGDTHRMDGGMEEEEEMDGERHA
jgi:hypothetical protein